MKNKNKIMIVIAISTTFLFTGCASTPPATTETMVATDQNTEEGDSLAESADIPLVDESPATDTDTMESEIDFSMTTNITGIIIEASTISVTIQAPDGEVYSLTIPEEGVGGDLSYMSVGQIATFTYAGALDETHAYLMDISANGMLTGIYLEEYAFAIKIINAVRAMDMKAISDLSNFPLFIDTGNYFGSMNTSGEFEAIDNEKIFTQELVDRIANYNLFEMEYSDSGFVLGKGGPNITFDVDDYGTLGIIGINSTSTPR